MEGSSNRICNMMTLPFGLPNWMSKDFLKGGFDGGNREKGGILFGDGSVDDGGRGAVKLNSQGSMESQGGSSSGVSKSENKSLQGSGNCTEARPASSNQSLQCWIHQEASGSSGAMTKEMASQKPVAEVANPSKPQSAEHRARKSGQRQWRTCLVFLQKVMVQTGEE